VLVFRVTSAGTKAEQRSEDEDMYKSSIEKVQPGLPMISERNDESLFVSQHSSKPHVLCWPTKCRAKDDYITVCPAVFVFFEGRSKIKKV